MATLLQVYNLIHDGEFQALRNRVRAAVLVAARAVILEDPATVNHADRLVWAQAAVQNAAALAEKAETLFVGVASDATIQAAGNAATDAQVQAAVNALVNYYAG
jgi:hypothetical protein